MATRTDLSGYAGDGPLQVLFQIFYLGNPLALSGILPTIVLKSSANQPDPQGSGPNIFTTLNGGLTITNASQGLGTWNIPGSFTTEPATYWWHGTFNNGGVITTWGFGNLAILGA